MAGVAAQASKRGGGGMSEWERLAGDLRRLSRPLPEMHQAGGEAQGQPAVLEHARASQAKQPKPSRSDQTHQVQQAHQLKPQRETGFGR